MVVAQYVFLHPTVEGFNPKDIVHTLMQNEKAVRSPFTKKNEYAFYICETVDLAQQLAARLVADDHSMLWSHGFISVYPSFLFIDIGVSQKILDDMASLLVPIITQYACAVITEHSQDVTHYFTENPYDLFNFDWGRAEHEARVKDYTERQIAINRAIRERRN